MRLVSPVYAKELSQLAARTPLRGVLWTLGVLAAICCAPFVLGTMAEVLLGQANQENWFALSPIYWVEELFDLNLRRITRSADQLLCHVTAMLGLVALVLAESGRSFDRLVGRQGMGEQG